MLFQPNSLIQCQALAMEARCAETHGRPWGEGLLILTVGPAQGQKECPRRWGWAGPPEPNSQEGKRQIPGMEGLLVQGLKPSVVVTGGGTGSRRNSFSTVGDGALAWLPRTTSLRPPLAKVRQQRPRESREFACRYGKSCQGKAGLPVTYHRVPQP